MPNKRAANKVSLAGFVPKEVKARFKKAAKGKWKHNVFGMVVALALESLERGSIPKKP